MLSAIAATLFLSALQASDASEARISHSQALKAAVEQDKLADATPFVRVERLAAAADAAARALVGDGAERALAAAVADARWRAFLDPLEGADGLARELRELSIDLTFEPLMEAPVPVGWPEWTPVQAILVQDYPAYRLASAPMDGSSQTGAFFALFNHISRNEIPMTAPVEVEFEEDGGYLDERSMAFLYESPDQETPAGVEGDVKIVDIAPRSALTIGMRGRTSARRIERAARELERVLATRSDLRASGELRTLGYNGPSVRRSSNYFEVQIPVERVEL